MSSRSGAAEAGHKHRQHHFHKFHNYDSYGWRGGGCGFYKRMWWKTGDRHWKRKYYRCIY